MHKARAFFFVCAGLLCLALAYHLGAKSATADVGSSVECIAVDEGTAFAIINRRLWFVPNPLIGGGGLQLYPGGAGTIPGAAPVVAVGNGAVILADGSVYNLSLDDSRWTYMGAFPSIPTPAVSQPTWGQVKAKYARPAPGKVTR